MAEEEGDRPSTQEMMDIVQITPEHIRANGTLHTSPFEGIAELIDNAIDSGARQVKIEDRTHRRILSDGNQEMVRYVLVQDDGAGMDRTEALKTILVGHSIKRGDVGMIGQFGNGLKSGSMRLGETMLLATRKGNEFTVLMISLKYMETVNDNKCYVPCISYTKAMNKQLVQTKTADESPAKHAAALRLILEYSPFSYETDLHDFLKKSLDFQHPSGTCIVVSDLKRLEDHKWEMPYELGDLVLKKREDEEQDKSLAQWLQQLYLEPKVCIMLHGNQVRLMDVRRSLAQPRWVLLANEGLGQFVEREKENVQRDLKKLNDEKGPVEQRVNELQRKTACVNTPPNKELHAELRRKQNELTELKKQIEKISERNVGKDKPGADIRVYLGLDVARRGSPRMIFYSSGRRIREEPIPFKKDSFHLVMGVVCIVDIPSTLLPTKQNREHFETPSEFDFIVKKLVKHAKTYFEHINKEFKTKAFWESLGYTEEHSEDIPNPLLPNLGKLLFEQTGKRRQCARCLEFRSVEWAEGLDDSLEKGFYECPNKRPGPGEKCPPKTLKEKDNEKIQQLDTTGTATFYGESTKAKPTTKAAKKPKNVRNYAGSSARPSPSRSLSRTPAKRRNKRSPTPESEGPTPPQSPLNRRVTRTRSAANSSSGAAKKKSTTARGFIDSSEGEEASEDDVRKARAGYKHLFPSNNKQSTRRARARSESNHDEEEEEDGRSNRGPVVRSRSPVRGVRSGRRSVSRSQSPVRALRTTQGRASNTRGKRIESDESDDARGPSDADSVDARIVHGDKRERREREADAQSMPPLFDKDRALPTAKVELAESADEEDVAIVAAAAAAGGAGPSGSTRRAAAPAAMTARAAGKAPEKRKMDEEKIAYAQSKKKKADDLMSMKAEPADAADSSSNVAAKQAPPMGSMADDPTIAAIYAGNFRPVQQPNAGSVLGSASSSLVGAGPMQSSMTRAQQERALQGLDKPQLIMKQLDLADALRKKEDELERLREQNSNLHLRWEEERRANAARERDLQHLKGLSTHDAMDVLRRMRGPGAMINATEALASAIAAITRERRAASSAESGDDETGLRAPSNVVHEEEC